MSRAVHDELVSCRTGGASLWRGAGRADRRAGPAAQGRGGAGDCGDKVNVRLGSMVVVYDQA